MPDYDTETEESSGPNFQKIKRRSAGTRAVRGHDKKKGHRPERKDQEEMDRTAQPVPVVTDDTARRLQETIQANQGNQGGGTNGQPVDPRAQRAADQAAWSCPICGGRKGGTDFIVCYAHNEAFKKAVATHVAILDRLGPVGRMQAVVEGNLTFAQMRPPTLAQWTLDHVDLAAFQRELDEATAAYDPIGAELQAQLLAYTRDYELPREDYAALKKVLASRIPGADDAYRNMRRFEGRLAAAKNFVAWADKTRIRPAAFLAEAPPAPAEGERVVVPPAAADPEPDQAEAPAEA